MAGYEVVNAPGGMSYGAPLVDFSAIGDLANTFMQGRQSAYQNRANQRQEDIATAFPNGIPMINGQPDYATMMKILASKGGIDQALRLAPTQADAALRGQASQLSPLLSPPLSAGAGAVPSAAQPPAPAAPQPGVIQSASLPAPAPNQTPGRGDQPGSVVDIVTNALPQDSATTGSVISNIARAVGVDPNAPLTAEQSARVTQLIGSYARRTGISPQASSPQQPAPGSPAARIAALFGAQGQRAQAQPPGPQAMSPQEAAPQPQPAPVQMPAEAPAAAAQPIIPQVPLPRGFNDPQRAIMALRSEAARLSSNPYAAGQVKELNDWATRIENSVAPIKVGPYETIVDPRTGQPLLRGPMAQNQGSLNGQSLEGAAQRYFQTGQFPSGMTRDTPTNRADRANIQQRAYEIADQQGITPDQLPAMWQTFSTRAAGLRTFEQRAAGLTLAENEAKTLIPRVREISQRISRTQYPTLNSIILAAQRHTGGTDVIRLGIAVNSLIPVYARVLKPTGQITEGDTHRASEILDKAWSDGQIDAALDQMGIELESAKKALADSREEYSGTARRPGARDQSAPAASSDKKTLSAHDQQALDWANKNPDDPRAAQIKSLLGVQ